LIGKYIPLQIPLLMGDEGKVPSSANNTVINNMLMGGGRVLSIGSTVFDNTLVANNTIVNASTSYSAPYTVRIGSGSYSNAMFQNNIIIQEGTVPIAVNAASGISFTNNNWSKTPPSSCQGTKSIISDPKIAKTGSTGPGSLTAAYFKFISDSPSRDAGVAISGISKDYFGTARPQGGAVDIGAYELGGETTTSTSSTSTSSTPPAAPSGLKVAP